ncbi:hypothetical protein Ciccas_006996 [Cichlidogyrus casuarinus]|uniref:Uncharacterized protein n=1 Tax=Cichlidogyrus casuarinus TaxID=1844966 RepID=A0ABD2Q448_9PLAT
MMGLTLWLLVVVVAEVQGFKEAARLFHDLLSPERHPFPTRFRPIRNHSKPLTVYLGLRLSQIIDVDEKNQIITTNAWLDHEWVDEFMQWNPEEYGNLTTMQFPSESIWIPDIVLQNNADGSFIMNIMAPATISHNGTVRWTPPAVFKSFCEIQVEFFPFDIQKCNLTFGVWSTHGDLVMLRHTTEKFLKNLSNEKPPEQVNISYAVDLQDFYQSVEFDILNVKAEAKTINYSVGPNPFREVHFYFTLRRKTLFYTVNLILPCVAISFLTLLVFYLPSQSGEKITLSINIMLSMTVFFLLLAETIPPTGLFIPLIGKYLLFIMINVSMSIVATVIVLNVNSRSIETHVMPDWVRILFLQVLPKLLKMQRPWVIETQQKMEDTDEDELNDKSAAPTMNQDYVELQPVRMPRLVYQVSTKSVAMESIFAWLPADQKERKKVLHIHKFVRNIRYIAKHLQYQDQAKMVSHHIRRDSPSILVEGQRRAETAGFRSHADRHQDTWTAAAPNYRFYDIQEDWKYVAMVLDRLFLWLFFVACVIGTLAIMLQAPAIYDMREPLMGENSPKSVNVTYDNTTEMLPIANIRWEST